MRFSRESFLPWPVPSTPFVPFACVDILGDLSLLVDPFIVANAAIDPLAVSVPFTRLVSFDLAGFLSSAGPFLLPASDLSGFLSSAEPFLLLAFDLPFF